MNTELLSFIGLVVGIGMWWLVSKTRLGAYIFLSCLLGGVSIIFLYIIFTVFFGFSSIVSKVGGVIIGVITFVVAWVKRDEPMDKIAESYYRGGTGGRKDGIDGGDG
jgi:hypothetical protein